MSGFAPALLAQDAPTPSAADLKKDEAITLSPFEVPAEKDNTYGALNSNSITKFKTELSKMPVSADIFDKKFIDDVDATSVEGLLGSYSAGAGMASSSPDAAAASSQDGDRNANSVISLRGLASTAILRDGFMPYSDTQQGQAAGTLFTPIFDTERAEVIYGPQSLLYGVGGGGGVENLVSKQARLGDSPKASALFRVDQYGNKTGTVDYGVGTDLFAVRFAASDQQVGGRRADIGGPFQGSYAQIAIRPIASTTIRISGESTIYNRFSNDNVSLVSLSTANDARNGQHLHYLLLTGQINAAANGGASGAGVIDNGLINWGNIDSFAGWTNGEWTQNQWVSATVDTVWSKHLSTEIATAYDSHIDDKAGNSASTFVAPNVAANTTGTWAAAQSSSPPFQDLYQPSHMKTLRVSAVLTNDFFDDRAKSQTVLGADTYRVDSGTISYNYVLADSNWNPVVNTAAGAANNGYTLMPTSVAYWPVTNGPVRFPLFNPRTPQVVVAGLNYIKEITNAPSAALVSPTNPEGLSGNGTGDFRQLHNNNKGIYFANYTDWWNGKLTSLVGGRYSDVFVTTTSENSSKTQPSVSPPQNTLDNKGFSFSGGLNYEVLPWLRPYVEVSDSFNPPQTDQTDPYGNYPVVSKALGEEAGLKVTNAAGTMSGQLAFFNTSAKNEETSFTSTIDTDINPTGLNGRFGAPSTWINVNRKTQGVQLQFTAAPIPNLLMKFGADWTHGTINSNVSYAQLYNDQFYENASGQVTYQDGTLVYVAPTTKAAISTLAAGGIPLTVAAMNTVGGLYYANPSSVNPVINSTSGAATILKIVDPVHGPILTGAVGLPISALQIANPNPNVPLPGIIPVAKAGDISSGYPQFSVNYTTTYTFRSIGPDWLHGLKIGGSVLSYWKFSEYYYYPGTLSLSPTVRTMFYKPNLTIFNGIFGYSHKVGRFLVTTQVNIGNMFNHYHVFVLPSSVNGYAGPNDATFDTNPRAYSFTTRIGF